MKVELTKRIEILDYEKEIGRELVIKERSQDMDNSMRFYAMFKGSHVIEGSRGQILSGTHGNGSTVHKAIEDYCRKISEQRIVFDDFDEKKRKEFNVPILEHTM